MGGRAFVTKQFDKPVYDALQALRVAHGDLSQWEILQASIVAFASRPKLERDVFIGQIHVAPSDQPASYPVRA